MFGAGRTSIKLGLKYEGKVNDALGALLKRESEDAYHSLLFQIPRCGGICDATFRFERRLFLIEVKSQWSLDAYKQLTSYAGSELATASRICICKVHHPHVPIPEPLQCLPLPRLLEARPGSLTIIPWSGRK